MNIDASYIDKVEDDFILLDKLALCITIELKSMKGEVIRFKENEDFDSIPPYLPAPAKPSTLGELVKSIIRRKHPVMDFLAERNGVKVVKYYEKASFRQSMACIEYGPASI